MHLGSYFHLYLIFFVVTLKQALKIFVFMFLLKNIYYLLAGFLLVSLGTLFSVSCSGSAYSYWNWKDEINTQELSPCLCLLYLLSSTGDVMHSHSFKQHLVKITSQRKHSSPSVSYSVLVFFMVVITTWSHL